MPEIQRKWYTEYPYLSCDIPYTLFKTPLNTEYTKTLADPDPCLLVRVHVSRRLRKGKHNYQNGACQYAYAKIIKVIFFPFALSLIKIHPCRPHKRRGNVRKNTQVRKKGLQKQRWHSPNRWLFDQIHQFIFTTRNRSITRMKNAIQGVNFLPSGRKGKPSSLYFDAFFTNLQNILFENKCTLIFSHSFGSCSECVTRQSTCFSYCCKCCCCLPSCMVLLVALQGWFHSVSDLKYQWYGCSLNRKCL